MYWKLEEAVKELKQRQNDAALSRKINDFLTDCPVPQGNFGFLARQIATCRCEDFFFAEKCRESGIEPVWLEYGEDRFCSNNPDKMSLVRLRVYGGRGRNGGPKLKNISVVQNFSQYDGVPLSRIVTNWGESLVEMHHRLREKSGIKGNCLDVSAWLQGVGDAKKYYEYFLAAVCLRGILFENFEDSGFPKLQAFKNRVVLPALEKVRKRFGCDPLIVIHPQEEVAEEKKQTLYWFPINPKIIEIK